MGKNKEEEPTVQPLPVIDEEPATPIDSAGTIKVGKKELTEETLVQIGNVAAEEGKEPYTASEVGAILAAYDTVVRSQKLGTIRRDPVTKAVAFRVELNGQPVWHIFNPETGEEYYDAQPDLDWPKLKVDE